jgi:hypothetical protein
MGIADSRLRRRRLVSPAPPTRPVPAPSSDAPVQPSRRRRVARVALAVLGVLMLAALGAAIAFVATRDERAASPTVTAAVAGTATVRRTATHAPPTASTHATRPTRAQTTERATTQRATTSGFVPARVFAWPVVAGADRYEIRFYRGPRLILRERVRRPRFVLPSSLHLSPGRYRWLVLPDVRGRFDRAIVDSRFSVVR